MENSYNTKFNLTKSYEHLTKEDILTFMKSRPEEEINELKAFTMVKGHNNFSSIRSWFYRKYYTQTKKSVAQDFINDIMNL